MMETLFYICSTLWLFGTTVGNKFTREELGVSGRLRFTSGQDTYYNCTVVNNILVSNLKIGIFIHDHTTSIIYKINDTQSFQLTSRKIEDFYFAQVKIISHFSDTNRYVKLTATNGNTGVFISETILRIQSFGKHLSNPVYFQNNTKRVITVFDDMFIGSVIMKLWKQNYKEDLIFYLSEVQLHTMHAFSVTADGRIILSRRLNAAKRSRYKFRVTVGYLYSSSRSFIDIQVNVVRGIRHLRDKAIKKSRHGSGLPLLKADTMPEFVNRLYNFSISELAVPSTIIGRLTEGQANVSFTISGGNTDNVFSIDIENSVLYISIGGKLDYEKRKFYILNINVRHNDLPSLATKIVVYVNVIDENDNRPLFSKSNYYVRVAANTAINRTILNLHATDTDSNNNADITYSISNMARTPFDIRSNGELYIRTSILSPNMYYRYYLYVRAIDSGTPIRQETEVVVEVDIVSPNAHPPVMKHKNCHIIISRDELQSRIVKFDAVDGDINTRLKYFIQSPQHSKMFLNSTSGILSIDRFINSSKMNLKIYAFDGLFNSTATSVVIEVRRSRKIVYCTSNQKYKDVKRALIGTLISFPSVRREVSHVREDYDLKFSAAPGEILHITEDAQVDTSLGVFKVGGLKAHCHTFVLYSIASGNSEHKFQIDLYNGTLYLYDRLEGYKTSRFNLKIKATDMYGNSVNKRVIVKVDRVNDTIPVFTNDGYYQCNKTELRLGRCKVKAIVSGNRSNEMTYEISSSGENMFTIDFKTGVISIKKSQFSLKESYIRVEASYGTKEVAHAVVHIVVTGGNTNPPRCLSHKQRIEIATNTPAGAIVGRIFGYDIDQGKAGRITYSILNKSAKFDAYFSLHSRTGLFKLKKALTAKDKGYRFSVGVKLEDSGRPRLSAVCQVFKFIVDAIGTYKPEFKHKQSPLVVQISSDVASKAVITEVNAAVSTLNKLNYQVVDGSGISHFTVDAQAGKVIVINSDFKKSFYWLTVQAFVENNPREFTNAHLLVRIEEVKLREPYFNPSVYHVTLNNDDEIGKKAIQVFASDGCQGYSADTVHFSIHSGDENNNFGVNADGWLYTRKQPPVGTYALNMTVANRQNRILKSHGYVVVQIEDNRIKPLIFMGSNINYIQIYESSSQTPPFLFQCLAKDMNSNYASDISYEILNTEAPFTIDKKTAVVHVKKGHHLRRGEFSFLYVKATTQQGKTLANMYNIQIIGVNDRPPLSQVLKFKRKSYYVTQDENSGSIFNFADEVKRVSYNPVFFYVYSGNENLMFTFPPGSPSELVPVNNLDYEIKVSYELGILAFDGISFTETKLFITLLNVDDNPISASQPCFQANVMENDRKADPLIRVQVTDLDHRDGSDYQYEMMSGVQNKDFMVLNSGEIYVKPNIEFDREVQSEHVVSVLAGVVRNAMTMFCVVVVIGDENDNSPKFMQSVYEKKVFDSVRPGTEIMAVYATDSDVGANALLRYSIPYESNFFDIEETTGVIFVKKDLTPVSSRVVTLDVVVKDSGTPPLEAYARVKIKVEPDWNSYTFEKHVFRSKVKEKLRSGSLVSTHITVNMSMVNYEIVKKDDNCYSLFWMDPFSGILLTTDVLDSEEHRNCTFTVNGLLHGGVVTSSDVFVQIEDENDNSPVFERDKYIGSVMESQKSFTQVSDGRSGRERRPLVIRANDFDAGMNGKIKYSFLENSASIYFTINENTGEVLTNRVLDYEKHPKRFEFHVKATDQGFFSRSNIVPLSIRLVNINDKKPEFERRYMTSLFLPVYNGTFVVKVTAMDDMTSDKTDHLSYSLDDPYGVFEINKRTGEVIVRNPSLLTNSSVLNPKVTASDGTYSTDTVLQIKLMAYTLNPSFKFLNHIHRTNIAENNNKHNDDDVIAVVNPVGYSIGEKISFKILNPTPFFTIGRVSGKLQLKKGAVLDREKTGYYLVHVEALKECDSVSIARTTINVTVLDLNDNSPVFPVKKYFGAFDFDTKYGATLLKVSATDADEGENAKIIYSIKSQGEERYFSINGYTGEISLKKLFIKRHSRLRQNLVITASDNGTPMLMSETTVEIVVLSKDQPMFTKTYQVSVSEDATIGQNLVKIEAKGRNERQVFYEIMAGDRYEMFNIGFFSGELSVSGRLNYTFDQSYLLTVKAIDSRTGSWSEGECQVDVIDINNHIPMFEKPFYDVIVLENIKVYSSMLQVKARDADAGQNARIKYTLSSQSDETRDLFTIHQRTGEIQLLSPLDAETKTSYLLHVTASDQGVPRKSSFTNVRITVQDVNDNKPYFLSGRYNFFADTYKPRQFIGRVQAFDPDINDRVVYSLAKNSSYIRVNPITGDVFLNSVPRHMYMFERQLVATDNKHHVAVSVNIQIRMRNEERPLLREKPVGLIREGSSNKREFILNVQARQGGGPSLIDFQIDSDLAKQYFSINNRGDFYTTGREFNREEISIFDVPVRATNRHGMFSLTDVVVKVLDRNDHEPLFEFPSYESYVLTSQISKKDLLEVKAFDMDEGSNAELAYSTQGLDEQSTPIHMNKTTGLISLAGQPKGFRYQFSARVTDNGFPIHQSSADVQIAVKRWTDELVRFSRDQYDVRAFEDKPIGAHLVTVQAVLNDNNEKISYTLINGNLPHTRATHFRIDYTTGKLTLTKPLNYERVKRHKLMVRAATISGSNSALCFVYIDVLNVNDNMPAFDSAVYSIRIAEDVQVGESILRVSANDPDDVTEHALKYKIVSGNTHVFTVNERNGWVKINGSLDREQQASYRLKIMASDVDDNSAIATVDVRLIDINDCPPVFNRTTFTLHVKEDELVQQVIGRIEARDADSTSTIQYFIKSKQHTDIFTIDSSNGDISLLRRLTELSYRFRVTAYDGLHRTSILVVIQVIDVNNHIPVCLNSFYNVEIDENSPRMRPLVQIRASDGDPTDKLKFIIQGDGIGKFYVDNHTGVLTANSVLDYETHSRYHFKVVVADRMDHTCTSDVFIKLIDVNDNIPNFEQELIFATVRENASQSVVLTQVKASDRDTGDNGRLTYSLAHEYDQSLFSISSRGVVTINKPLPKGKHRIPKYTMKVTATDNGVPALSSSVRLQVLVLAETDTPPKFEKLGYEFEINENEPYGKVIGHIRVKTSNNLKDKRVNMQLINAAPGVFRLDNNGNLSVNALLDYEVKSRYIFSVKCWFEMIPSLSSLVNVEISIVDVNDHKPVFNSPSYFKKIDENVRAGTFVLQTFATDGDGTSANSQIAYRLISRENIPFQIDATSGNIEVSESIDYEVKHSYKFHVIAEDNGTPRISTHVDVVINITDLNDNPPLINRNHSNVIVQEGTQPGSNLLELFITDLDSPANAAPFFCSLLNGDVRRFAVVTGKRNNCVIQSKTYMDLRERDTYDLVVRVTDSGTPKQFSDSTIEIVIVQESHHAPVLQAPKMFFVIMSKPYVVTNIGEIKVKDEDVDDLHQFHITAGNNDGIFSIQEMRGIIEGKPSKGVYNLSVEVTDGKFVDSGIFKIIVNELTEELRVKSITVRFESIDAQTFVRTKIMQFIRRFARICGTSFDNVFIWSVQNAEEKNDNSRDKRRLKRQVSANKNTRTTSSGSQTVIAMAVMKMDSQKYFEVGELRNYLQQSRLDFIDLGLDLSVGETTCRHQRCSSSQTCVLTNTPEESVSYNIPAGYMAFKQEEKCFCDDGSEGPVCYPRNSCLRNPCKFGEKCIQTTSSYRCECIDPSKCTIMGELRVKSFTGDSFIKYMLSEPFDELFTSLNLDFKTDSEADQIIFYANGKDYFIVEVVDGNVRARFDFGSGVGSLLIDHVAVNDGNWHHVHITRLRNYVKLSLDNHFSSDGSGLGTSARININGQGIVFGAGLSDGGSIAKGFIGCLKQPRLGKKMLPFQGSDYVAKVEMHRVRSGCKDSCAGNTCPAFSDCINNIDSYRCRCVPGHHGPLCLSRLTCKDKPCKNNGVCTYTEINGAISYHCSCKPGFTGAQCHISRGICVTSRCQNGATCLPDSDSYKCLCLPGYTGAKCEIFENPCAAKKCYYGGTCVNKKNDFECACAAGHMGRECAAGNYCLFTKCLNGGTCSEQRDGASCVCREGFTGSRCQLDINECFMQPCHSNEVCVNSFGSYYCNCSNGVQSKDCQLMVASTKEEGFSLVFVVAGGLVLLVIVAVVIIAVVCFRKRKHRYSHARTTTDTLDFHKYPLDRYPRNDMEMNSMFSSSVPRGGGGGHPPPDYFDDQMSAAAAMYDPSALTFSDPSLADEEKTLGKYGSSVTASDEEEEEDMKSISGYHWDYCGVPEDLNMKMSREGSRIGRHDHEYYSDEDEEEELEYVDLPPNTSRMPEQHHRRTSAEQNNHHRTSSVYNSECDHYDDELQGPSENDLNAARLSLDLDSTQDYDDRYSLYDNEAEEDTYIHDLLDNEDGSDITTVTRPSRPYSQVYMCAPPSQSEGSEVSEADGYTETSLCSDEDEDDDDDDNRRVDPLDPDNTRQLERDIKKLLKDLQKKTDEIDPLDPLPR